MGNPGVYSIGAVARMLDIPPATLRNWEDRYALVVPERSAGGHRLYSRENLEHLHFIVGEIQRGLSPADAHRLLEQRRSAISGAADPSEAVGDVPQLLILLAERDRRAAALSEYFLRTEGYGVALALDADEIRAIEAREPDLIILELMISGGTGIELCRRLRSRTESPILTISSLRVRDAALDAGADAFLLKPFEPLELVSAVQDLLGRSAVVRRDGVPVA